MIGSTHTDVLVVSEEEEGLRLDKLLADRFPAHSRTYFQYLIENGGVLVNGELFKKREKPNAGDEIEICFLLTPEISLEAQNIPLEILYEDEHILAINKPVGMVVHPAPGHPHQTFVNALLYHCKQVNSDPSNNRPGIVHRLDKDTSGVLLAAKTKDAHQALISLFCERKIKKKYLAVCLGNPGNQTISAPLKRHPVHRQKMCVSPLDGREAISHVCTLKIQEKFSLVDVHIITGRTHQIRAHLKHIGHPILGDPVYGNLSINNKLNEKTQLLHARSISFEHPFLKKNLEIIAPLPKNFTTCLQSLSLS